MSSAPTVKAIADDFGPHWRKEGHDVTEYSRTLAQVLSEAKSKRGVDDALKEANRLLGGHGIEAIRGNGWTDSYYGDIVALYVNMGDTYEATILFDVEDGTFKLTSYGDWVQEYEQTHDQPLP